MGCALQKENLDLLVFICLCPTYTSYMLFQPSEEATLSLLRLEAASFQTKTEIRPQASFKSGCMSV